MVELPVPVVVVEPLPGSAVVVPLDVAALVKVGCVAARPCISRINGLGRCAVRWLPHLSDRLPGGA
jgi:hypothetical protein